jgi:hypothetical protein
MALAPLIAPEVEVTATALLIPLVEVVGFGVALGMIYSSRALVNALFGTAAGIVGWVPFVGHVVKRPIIAIQQKLVHALSAVAAPLDARMGAALHSIATIVGSVGESILALEVLQFLVVDHLIRKWAVPTLLHRLRALGRTTVIVRTTISHPTKGRIGGATKAAVGSLALTVAVLSRYAHTRIRALEHAGTAALPNFGRFERRARIQARRIGRLERITAGIGAAALVATALNRLGLKWIRCRKVGRVGRAVCGMDDRLLEGLLLDAAALTVALNLRTFAKELQDVTGEAAHLIRSQVK